MTSPNNLQSAIGNLQSKDNLQSNEEVLTYVQASVSQALEAVRERERDAESLILAGGNQEPVHRVWTEGLRAYQEKLHNLQNVAEQAGASVADVNALLAAGETGFRDWLAATARAREKLTGWLAQSAG